MERGLAAPTRAPLAPPAPAVASPPARVDAPPPAGRTFASLDGLRVVFMAWVLFYHLPVAALAPAAAWVQHHWTWGVTGFLALSGFLLARSLAPEPVTSPMPATWTRRRVREVFARRTARIVPGYWAMLAVVAVAPLLPTRSLGVELLPARHDLPGFAVFAGNYLIATHVDHLPLVLRTYWSLQLQEQFLALMCVAFVLARGRVSGALLAMALGSLALRVGMAAGPWREGAYYDQIEGYTHLNLDAMAWGALAWLHYDRLGALWATPRRARLATAAILAACVLAVVARSWWWGNLSQAVLQGVKYPALALLVRLVCEHDAGGGRVMRLLRHRALRLPSLASYEIYLVHALCYRAAMLVVSPGSGGPFIVVAIALAAAVGTAMHVAFTKPAQRWVRARLLPAA